MLHSLKSKLLIILGLSMIIPVSIVSIISFNRSSNIIVKESETKLLEQVQNIVHETDKDFFEFQVIEEVLREYVISTFDINQYKESQDSYVSEYNKDLYAFMTTLAHRYSGKMMGIFVTFDPNMDRSPDLPVHGYYYMDVDLNGNFKTYEVNKPSAFIESDPTMNWFYGSQKLGHGVWSSLLDVYTNEMTFDYNSFVKINNTLICVFGIKIKNTDLNERLSKLKIYDTGIASLVVKNFEGSDSEEYIQITGGGKSLNGINRVVEDGVEYIVAYDEMISGDILIIKVPVEEVISELRNFTTFLIILIFIVIIISITAVSYIFSNVLITPILSAVEVTEHISEGNLGVHIDKIATQRNDEIGVLFTSLNKMKRNLVEIVSTVLTSVKQIETASATIADDNVNLLERTEQQAAALEQTFAAIEEMNGSVKSNADNTTTADNLSREAANKTGAGAESVLSVIGSMNEINDSSNRIADIIEVINNIAFQTNLLALNASIEAARAGEQGKGFAVVAVEVRKLAKRSDRAAGEISEIIKSSNIKVDQGVEIANKAGDVLEKINISVKKVTDLVGEISASSKEQLTSVDEIDRTLATLDKNTQMNSTMVDKATEATEKLSRQSRELSSMMDFFKIEDKVMKRDQTLLDYM